MYLVRPNPQIIALGVTDPIVVGLELGGFVH